MVPNTTNRVSYLDVAKGLAMLWVVLGHITSNGCLQHYIYSFHMMIFFFISGVLMNVDKYPDFKNFLKSRIKTLYIPFCCLYIVLYLYWLFVERGMRAIEIPPLDAFLGMFWGSDTNYWLYPAGPLWFVVCLFSLEVVSFPLLKLYNQKKTLSIICFFVLFGVGVVLSKLGEQGKIPLYCLPLGLNNGLIVLPFFVVGYVCRKPLLQMDGGLPTKYVVLVAVGSTILSCVASQLLTVDISYLRVSNWLLYIVVPFLGISSWLAISKLIDSNRWLEWVGCNTLPILAFHGPIIRIVIFVIGMVIGLDKGAIKNDICFTLGVFVLTIFVCIPVIVVWNKVYDESVKKLLKIGKYKQNNINR